MMTSRVTKKSCGLVSRPHSKTFLSSKTGSSFIQKRSARDSKHSSFGLLCLEVGYLTEVWYAKQLKIISQIANIKALLIDLVLI